MITRSYTELIGQDIDKARSTTWRWPAATVCVKREDLKAFTTLPESPQLGDVMLCQVTELGQATFLENRFGCNMQIFPGTVMLGVLSSRYAVDEYEARVPVQLEIGQEVALLNRGGTLGEIFSTNSAFGHPTQVRILAAIQNEQGDIVNTRKIAPQGNPAPAGQSNKRPKLILVVGSSMNAGKSNAAKAAVYALAACGKTVVAGKATGCAARRDIMLMKSAGAINVADMTEFGYPSSYLLERDEVVDLFWRIYNNLAAHAGPDGYIVMEIADGILQRETEMLLSDPNIQASVHKLLFACGDPLSAQAGIDILRGRYNLSPAAFTGMVGNSELAIRELKGLIAEDIPVFDNMVIDVPSVAELIE